MPKSQKSFQFGRRRRHAKARGLSLLRQQENTRENSDTANGAEATTTFGEQVDPSFATPTESGSPQSAAETSTPSRIRSKLSMYNLLNMDEEMYSSESHFLLVHTSFFSSLMSFLICPSCHARTLSLKESSTYGLAVKCVVYCSNCEEEVWSDFTSPCGPKRYDINNRFVLASKETGFGYDKLSSFFSLMNISTPMHHSTYQEISQNVHRASVEAAESVMRKAAAIIQERYSSGDLISDRQSSTGCPVITVSYDGTWQKRGHSSHNGVGVAIDADSGLVVDTHTVSNFCMACEKGPKQGTDGYLDWYEEHKKNCQRNSDCSSNAMEMVAAQEVFSRSVVKRGLVYGNMLCDGDSKAFVRVRETAGYDIEIEKMDCINHIAKRMFNALDAVKKTNKGDLNRKLTKPMMDKITNTYAKNLKNNAPDVEKMKNGVMGGILHMASTDDNPNHRHCPVGETSWCGYQRAIAKGQEPPPHNTTFKPEVLPFVWPIVKRLTDSELLQRCSKMLTQNANESFNAQIWRRCSKTVFASRTSVETAVALAVLSFNCGPSGIKLVMARLGLQWNRVCHEYATEKTKDKVARAEKKNVSMSQWKRKHRKSQRLAIEHARESTEGSTYLKGAFNT